MELFATGIVVLGGRGNEALHNHSVAEPHSYAAGDLV
jgi:hypothetical protein